MMCFARRKWNCKHTELYRPCQYLIHIKSVNKQCEEVRLNPYNPNPLDAQARVIPGVAESMISPEDFEASQGWGLLAFGEGDRV